MQMQDVGFDTTVRIAYHCTPSPFVNAVAANNVLPFQHPRNTKSTASDPGYFGDNKKGVYFAGSFDTALIYGCSPRAAPRAGENRKVIVFLVMPGRERVLTPLAGDANYKGIAPTRGYTSHTTPFSRPDGQRTEWYLYNSTWDLRNEGRYCF